MTTKRIFNLYSLASLFLLIVFVWLIWPDSAQAEFTGEESIKSILYFIVINVFGWLLGIAGFLLDYAIENFVINFGGTFNSGVGAAVNALWVTVRDMFNIIFIFGLVYLGFKMILNSDDSGTRQGLVYLIMAALLINFSLFITKFVVDFSNVLAREVAVAGFSADPASGRTLKVADTFFNFMQIKNTLALEENIRDQVSESWSFIFGNALIYLIGLFVFASGAIMLIIRFVALSIYMVLSPFMFLGWVFPGFKNVTSSYWRGFLGRAFYAPVYILLVYFAAFILHNMFGASGTAGPGWGVVPAGSSPTGYDSFGEIIAPFLLSSAFLLAAVQVAGKLSKDAGTFIDRAAVKATKRMTGRVTAGSAGWIARNTVGRGAQTLTNNDSFKRYASRSALGRQMFKGTQAVAGSSFDARNVGGVGKSLGVGPGQKGGYAKAAKDRAKAEDKLAKDLAVSVDFDDPAVQYKLKQKEVEIKASKQAEIKEIEAEREKLKKDPAWHKKQLDLGEKIVDLEHEIEKGGGTATDEQAAELSRLELELHEDEFIIDKKIEKLQKDAADAHKIAKGELKFESELAYMEQLKRSENFWKKAAYVGGIGAAGGALALGGAPIAIAAAGAVGFSALRHGQAGLSQAGHKEIEKRIGTDGTKGLKNEKRKKDARLLKDILDEEGGSKDKKDDDKADDT